MANRILARDVHVLGSDYTDLEGGLGLWKGVFEESLGCRDIFIIVDSYYVTERILNIWRWRFERCA